MVTLVVKRIGFMIFTMIVVSLILFLLLETGMLGVFLALDFFLFYVFWEVMLLPMYFLIGVWGGPRKLYAAIKFFLYTFLGSVFMLVGLIYLYIQTGTWSILEWHQVPLAMTVQKWLFLGFLAAFSVKIPMWPVHTWLPDAHVEAPTGGSVILAAIMLKIGGYGFIRFSLPITPDAAAALDWLIIALSLIAVVYIGFVALVQEDMKKLIAYSSISHMGFVTLGMFIAFAVFQNTESGRGAALGVEGAMVQMISHGFVSGALFLCVGVLYDRVHSRMIKDYGGVANTMPWFAALAVLFFMANAGLPGTSGFVGEFIVERGLEFLSELIVCLFGPCETLIRQLGRLGQGGQVLGQLDVVGAVAGVVVAERRVRLLLQIVEAVGAVGLAGATQHEALLHCRRFL